MRNTRRDALTRLRTNPVVDIVMLIVFIPGLLSGIVLRLVPRGYLGGRYATGAGLPGLSRATRRDIHIIAGFAIAALLVLHLLPPYPLE